MNEFNLRLTADDHLKAHGEAIRLDSVSKQYGSVIALKATELEIRKGEFFSILGPSGSGKSTLLKLIGGFEKPTTGTVRIGSMDVTDLPANKRPVATVFQNYALFPHLTVLENVGFGLRAQGVPKPERARLATQFLEIVNLSHKAQSLPKNLSGGEQQRVALARALAVRPRILLLDEPLGALDLKLREAMQEQLRLLHKAVGSTFVMVTHDQDEAMSVANRVAVMQGGEIREIAAPVELYQAPRSEFVGRFVGVANIFECDLLNDTDGKRYFVSAGIRLHAQPAQNSDSASGKVHILVRPENTILSRQPGGIVDGIVRDSLFINGTNITVLDTPIGIIRSRSFDGDAKNGLAPGVSVSVSWNEDDVVVLERG